MYLYRTKTQRAVSKGGTMSFANSAETSGKRMGASELAFTLTEINTKTLDLALPFGLIQQGFLSR